MAKCPWPKPRSHLGEVQSHDPHDADVAAVLARVHVEEHGLADAEIHGVRPGAVAEVQERVLPEPDEADGQRR